MSEKKIADVPRVLRVEYLMRAKISTGRVYADATDAEVMTPMGQIYVRVRGYHATKDKYPALMAAAMDVAWGEFCNA